MANDDDDINDRQAQASRLVAESKKVAGVFLLMHKFLDSAAEAVVIVDKQGKIVFFNQRAVFLFGWLPEEVVGQVVEILLPDALRSKHTRVHRAGYMILQACLIRTTI